MKIVNQIVACSDGILRPRNLDDVTSVMIHRIGPFLGSTEAKNAVAISKWFQMHEDAHTGREMPYTFVIGKDGTTEQALALGDIGPHAKKFNKPAVSVAFIGDFREVAPSSEAFHAGVELVSELISWIGCGTLGIYSHSELIAQGASSDRTKQCPGHLFSMNAFRSEVQLYASGNAFRGLEASGVVF